MNWNFATLSQVGGLYLVLVVVVLYAHYKLRTGMILPAVISGAISLAILVAMILIAFR